MATKKSKKGRKEEKRRPYRVDYFNVPEVEGDRVPVRSAVVRAVTAAEAKKTVLSEAFRDDRVVVKAYRFYKELPRKPALKAMEDLFPGKKAVEVMERVEARRAAESLLDGVPVQATAGEDIVGMFHGEAAGRVTEAEATAIDVALDMDAGEPGLFYGSPPTTTEEKAIDAGLEAAEDEESGAESGPDSPATVAVLEDYRGMMEHDAHERVMDTFQPTSPVPEGTKPGLIFPPAEPTAPVDLDEIAPVVNAAPLCPTCGAGRDTDGDGNCLVCGSAAWRWASPPAALPGRRLIERRRVRGLLICAGAVALAAAAWFLLGGR